MFFKKNTDLKKDDLDSVIAFCLKKDPRAQKALIKLFYGYTKSISSRYSGTKEETEEIINDSFLKVFNNLSKYDHTLPFKAWLRTIVVNTAIDSYRRNQKYAHQVDIEEVELVDLNDDIITKISAEEILVLIQQLTPAYRMVFTLYVIEGYNHKEIAQLLGIKEGTSKSNLQDARKKLQQSIKKMYPHLYMAYTLKSNKINEN